MNIDLKFDPLIIAALLVLGFAIGYIIG